METRPPDPAQYLDTEEAIAAYLADAGADGDKALSDAAEIAESLAFSTVQMSRIDDEYLAAFPDEDNSATSLAPRRMPVGRGTA